MGKAKGKHRLDKYYHLAKEHGYRSRAAWKLVQLDSKHDFLSTARSALDLCAAPGGWMQVAVQRMPVASFVVGVDLVPIRPIRGAVSFQSDISQSKCLSTLKKLMSEHGCRAFDLVLHDGSPNIGGAWATEATSQNALVIDSVKLACELLAPKGTFVTKIFRSQDYSSVIYCLKQLFAKVEVVKPLASRSTSAEIYIVCFKFKAPAKIDPRLLDMKHLFQGSIQSKKVVDVLRGTKQKRNRDGYEDGNTTARKVSSVSDFIWSSTPLDILGSVNSLEFEGEACFPIKNHDLTTEEVKCLCEDLLVLGKHDFKNLLKWRMKIRNALSQEKKVESSAEKTKDSSEIDEADKIMNEMEELTNALDKKKKREKKNAAKRLAKDKKRKVTGEQVDVLEDDYTEHELFSLSSIKGKKELVALDSINHDDGGEHIDDDSEHGHAEAEDALHSDMDSDEEQELYDQQLEDMLDQAYEQFVSRREGSALTKKRLKKSYAEDDDQLLEGGENEEGVDSGTDSEKAETDEENPLVVSLSDGRKPSQEEITERWFSQDLFAGAVEGGDLEMCDLEQVKAVTTKKASRKPLSTEVKASSIEETKDKLPQKHTLSSQQDAENGDFIVVPATADGSSDDSTSSSEDEGVDAKAEILACAKKMLRKKSREQMLDDAYNRYMFDDDTKILPRWFTEEEEKHHKAMKPVTKEEVAAMKAQFKEIDQRPVKKVAEAKARKKRSTMRKLENVKKKAEKISDQGDISERSKKRMIEQIYKKAGGERRPQREYVVAKKGVPVHGGKGKVVVDRRLKKDKRAKGVNKKGRGAAKKGKVKKGRGAAKKGKVKKAQGGNGKNNTRR